MTAGGDKSNFINPVVLVKQQLQCNRDEPFFTDNEPMTFCMKLTSKNEVCKTQSRIVSCDFLPFRYMMVTTTTARDASYSLTQKITVV